MQEALVLLLLLHLLEQQVLQPMLVRQVLPLMLDLLVLLLTLVDLKQLELKHLLVLTI
jgi:hypothetical protein